MVLKQVERSGLVGHDQRGIRRDGDGRGDGKGRAASCRGVAVDVDRDVHCVGAVHVGYNDAVDLVNLIGRRSITCDAEHTCRRQQRLRRVTKNCRDVDDVWVCHVCSLQAEDHCESDALALGNARSREGLEGRKRPRAVGCQHLTRSTWTR